MMRGYWNDPDATAATIVDGWLHTGDLAVVDERGLLRLAGRSQEMYVRGGYNVYPMEVEAVLAGHPAVRDIAIVPRPDPVMGDIGVAVVLPRDPAAPPTLDDLRTHAAGRLAAYKLPEAIRVVDDLPLTAMQKIDRAALAAAEAEVAASEVAPS
jgi:acyl-CoA synthetase (AMP-forming)/AMP-acid ligase II